MTINTIELQVFKVRGCFTTYLFVAQVKRKERLIIRVVSFNEPHATRERHWQTLTISQQREVRFGKLELCSII